MAHPGLVAVAGGCISIAAAGWVSIAAGSVAFPVALMEADARVGGLLSFPLFFFVLAILMAIIKRLIIKRLMVDKDGLYINEISIVAICAGLVTIARGWVATFGGRVTISGGWMMISREWMMVSGGWVMITGVWVLMSFVRSRIDRGWVMIAGGWLMITGEWLVIPGGCLMFHVGWMLIAAGCVAGCLEEGWLSIALGLVAFTLALMAADARLMILVAWLMVFGASLNSNEERSLISLTKWLVLLGAKACVICAGSLAVTKELTNITDLLITITNINVAFLAGFMSITHAVFMFIKQGLIVFQ
ncbi:uncharacterized protein LOC125177897 [Hyalella azteca]|uniref:Uncharacterized protein LOC125177897 n=1 Tax=Hyalella azteca TaxID=294128 RepID=A0A979FIA3_HYAAZ|nr:uncharacterized protein LOC125177897 [Hyalella azteca]